jgi:hypothetical protein
MTKTIDKRPLQVLTYLWRKRRNANCGRALTQNSYFVVNFNLFNLITLLVVVDGNYALLCYYVERSGKFLPTFQGQPVGPSFKDQ